VGAEPGYGWGNGPHILQQLDTFSNAVGFTSGVTGYSGFRFTNGSGLHNGWVEWTHTLATGAGTGLVEVSNWAFESTPGAAIKVGDLGAGPAAVPEPGPEGLALLAGGVGGLLAWRRRRKPAGKALSQAA